MNMIIKIITSSDVDAQSTSIRVAGISTKLCKWSMHYADYHYPNLRYLVDFFAIKGQELNPRP